MAASINTISIRNFIARLKNWTKHLVERRLLIIIVALIGGMLGLAISFFSKPTYTGNLTFVLSSEQNPTGGLMALASQLGLSFGSKNNAFDGENIIKLFESKKMFARALFQKIPENNQLLINEICYEEEFFEDWSKESRLKQLIPFTVSDTAARGVKDSLVTAVYKYTLLHYLSLDKIEKELNFYKISVTSTNERVSYFLPVALTNVTAKFYTDIKSDLAKRNLSMLEREADSLRYVLNRSLQTSLVQREQVISLNPAFQSQEAPARKSEVQTRVLQEAYKTVVQNLEIARVTLQRVTPVYQIIDEPGISLRQSKPGLATSFIMGFMLTTFFFVFFLLIKKNCTGFVILSIIFTYIMLKYIDSFSFKGALQSTIFKNYFFLSIYQIVNFAVPLIVVPFLISRVGVANFGRVAFSYAFVNYFNVIVDYGFNLSATQKISVNRRNRAVVNTVFTTVYASKLIFLIISLSIYLVIIYSVPALYSERWLHLLGFTLVVGQALIPIWLFQGMEDMRYLAICNIVSKLIYFICILIYIKLPGDYFLVNFFQGVSGIIAGLLSLYFTFRKFNVRFIPVTVTSIKAEISGGKMLFFSAIAVNIYLNSNAFILGILASPAEVGIYSIAEKVYYALKQLNNVFSQVIFPQICLLAQKSVFALKAFFKKIFAPFLALVVLSCIVVFFASNLISTYFLKGEVNEHLIQLINIFCVIIIINACVIPAFQTLLAYNEKSKYGRILILGCVVNIIFNIVLVNLFQSLGTAYAMLITESFITLGLGYYFLKVLKQKSIEVQDHI